MDMRISGSGSISGGVYDNVRVSGSGNWCKKASELGA